MKKQMLSSLSTGVEYMIKRTVMAIAFVLIVFSVPSVAAETARQFLDGLNAYHAGEFNRAVTIFNKLAEEGVRNPKLYYNLANACLKADELGHAVLWYEKALKLAPGDPDIRFNYQYALSLTTDERTEKEFSLSRVFFFWKFKLSEKTIQISAIVLNIIFWVLLVLRLFFKFKPLKITAAIILVPALVLSVTAAYNYYESANIKKGIILPAEVSVRSGLTDDSTQLFVLHAGTKVSIEKESRNHLRIYYSDGKIGWVRVDQIGVI